MCPNSSNMNNDKLLNLIEQVTEGNSSHILLLGDFNYRNIDWQQGTTKPGADRETCEFLEKINMVNLCHHVKSYTRERVGQQPSILDLVFTNEVTMANDI